MSRRAPQVPAPIPSNSSTPTTAQIDLLMKALAFIDKASGAALGVAVSGSAHPNPDEVLLALFHEGNELSAEIRADVAKATKPVTSRPEGATESPIPQSPKGNPNPV